VDEIRLREDELRHYLLQQCTKEITMPQCLELVTALRRLNNLELERQSSSTPTSTTSAHKDLETTHSSMELKLQVDFLEARDLWLQKHHISYPTTTVTAASNTTNEQLLDWIEHYRTKCFEIATQFTTIFGTTTTTTTSTTTTTETNTSITKPYSLLSLWFSRVLQSFLLQLQKQLDTITSTTTTTTTSAGTTVMSTLRDVLDATTFFATSMGRIGGDFTPLLPQIFETRVVRIVTRMWTEATDAFDQTLRICRDAGIASPLITTTTTTFTTTTTTSSSSSSTNMDHPNYDGTEEGGVLPSEFGMATVNAPRSLLLYPPLARFVNTYMSSLNDLRRCLLPGTFPLLLSNLTDKIIPSMKFILEANERKLLTPGMLRGDTLQLRQLASQYKVQLTDVVEPFLLDALRMALGYDYSTSKKDITTSNTTSTTNNRSEGTTNTSTIITDIDPNTENQQEGDTDDEKATSDEHSIGHEVKSNEELYTVADTVEREMDTVPLMD
jgi:hypothetical protein